MATFGELQTSVSKRLLDANNTAVSSSDVATALNDSIAYWKFRRFFFNEETYDDTLTAQDSFIPLPDDFLLPAFDDGAFVINYSAMKYPLGKISSQEFNNVYLTNGFGLPLSYARVGSDYRCYYIPDRDYDFTGYYLKDYVDIAQENYNATNDFTDFAPRLLVLWACSILIAELRQDEKMEAYYTSRAQNEYRNLLVMTNKSNASGRLTINSVL